MPERFMKSGTMEPNPDTPFPVAAFGFGRRICPGQHLAYESLWIAVASVLAAYDITPALDDEGRPVIPTTEPNVGFASYVFRLMACE